MSKTKTELIQQKFQISRKAFNRETIIEVEHRPLTKTVGLTLLSDSSSAFSGCSDSLRLNLIDPTQLPELIATLERVQTLIETHHFLDDKTPEL